MWLLRRKPVMRETHGETALPPAIPMRRIEIVVERQSLTRFMRGEGLSVSHADFAPVLHGALQHTNPPLDNSSPTSLVTEPANHPSLANPKERPCE